MRFQPLALITLVLFLLAALPPRAASGSADADADDSATESWYPETPLPPLVDDDDSAAPALPDPTDEEIEEAIAVLFSGAAAGWSAVVLAVVTLLGALLRRFGVLGYLPDPWPAVIACLLALAGSVGAAGLTGVVWYAAIAFGLFGGAAQLGIWVRLIGLIPEPRRVENPA